MSGTRVGNMPILELLIARPANSTREGTMATRIPAAHIEPLRTLREMPTEQRQAMAKRLRAAGPILKSREYVSLIAAESGMANASADGLVRALISMYRRPSTAAIEFAEEVADDLRSRLGDATGGTDAEWRQFASDLVEFLTCDDSIGVLAKASVIRLDDPNVFCSAKIRSDIRPIFGGATNFKPVAAAIVHTLKITSHAEGEHVSKYFALDASDLMDLRDVIDRAIKKEESLCAEISKLGVELFDGGED
ncbi:MAG TPA: hypothetical protein P5081_18330 [Phycisphaerae bacterium]|nr:hypothetical protein [Phycisphaerae bacterium]HRW54830.1 hypothetical protein [Phycisphaerae bacterium]